MRASRWAAKDGERVERQSLARPMGLRRPRDLAASRPSLRGVLSSALILVALAGVLLATAGCELPVDPNARALAGRSAGGGKIGEIRTESRAVELVGAETVDVRLDMGIGELRVNGGAEKLMEGDFTYNVPEWRPRVEYSVDGSAGSLLVKQPSSSVGAPPADIRYKWDLRLSDDVPMTMSVKSGVGSSRLDLRGLDLTRLDVEVGVGEMVLDLGGPWERDLDVTVKGGIGSTTVRVPEGVGVTVQAKGGIGSVEVEGLRKDGDRYVNDAYGVAPVTVRVTAESGIGEIRLEQGE